MNAELIKANQIFTTSTTLVAADMLAIAIVKRLSSDEVSDTLNDTKISPAIVWAQVNSKIRQHLEPEIQ